MKIYNKKGLVFGILWAAMGSCPSVGNRNYIGGAGILEKGIA